MDLSKLTIVDLTHRIEKEMTIWPDDPPVTIRNLATIKERGYFLNEISIGEHSGTHIGAPAHFIEGGADILHLPIERLFRPAIKVEKSSICAEHSDYLLPVDAVLEWEQENGEVPADSVFILQTGWSRYWKTEKYLNNHEGRMHFPGVSIQAAEFLVYERGVCAIGIDTHGVDGGLSQDYSVNHLLAKKGLTHLENLTNLDQLPQLGALLFIGALPLVGGSGSPCRVMALY